MLTERAKAASESSKENKHTKCVSNYDQHFGKTLNMSLQVKVVTSATSILTYLFHEVSNEQYLRQLEGNKNIVALIFAREGCQVPTAFSPLQTLISTDLS